MQQRAYSTTLVTLWSMFAAFGTYFCMYAFRKPFTAGSYDDQTWQGLNFKVVLVTAQVFGYMLSKFLGIKFIAEVRSAKRAVLIMVLILVAEIALVLFALTPAPYCLIWMFVNGIPLGMVFGLVLGFLEGRRQTEALAAGLCTSFIVADGVTRSLGAYLLFVGVDEAWMPAVAGASFLAPLSFCTWMLTRIPTPNEHDIAARAPRVPMDRHERFALLRRYGMGLGALVLAYLLITILRSVRADFAKEIWLGLGVSDRPAVYAWSEMAVALGVLLVNGMVVFFDHHRRALLVALALALCGTMLVPLAFVGLTWGLSPFAFMVLHGLGLYMPYIAVHTTIFERFIALTRERGNIGFLMYVADAFGYLGYVAVLLARQSFAETTDFFEFFAQLSWFSASCCVLLLLIVAWRFSRYTQRPSVALEQKGPA